METTLGEFDQPDVEAPNVETPDIENVPEEPIKYKYVGPDDMDFDDYILVNFLRDDRADSFLVPTNMVFKIESLKDNNNFSLHISDYYLGNKGLELLKAGNEEVFNEWAEKEPMSAAMLSIIWQCEGSAPFEKPEWWPYVTKAMHTNVLCPGRIYCSFMVKLIINVDFRINV